MLACWILFFVLVLVDKSFFSFSFYSLVKMGGAYNISIYDGEYWRLFTYIFIHNGFFHVLMNMAVFLIVGVYAEKLFSKFELIVVILVTSFAAGVAGFYLRSEGYHVSVGFSGVIMALLGGSAAKLLFKIKKDNQSFHEIFFIVLWVLFDNLMALVEKDNTSVEGHLTGFVTGFILIALNTYAGIKIPSRFWSYIFLIILANSILYASIIVIKNTPNDIYRLDKIMNHVIASHDSLINNWSYFDSLATFQEQQLYAKSQIRAFNSLIQKVNQTDTLEVESKLHGKASNYRSILWLDRTYLTRFYFKKENEKELTQEDINHYRIARDSLFAVYYE